MRRPVASRQTSGPSVLTLVTAWILLLSWQHPPRVCADVFRVLEDDHQAIQARVDLIQQAQREIKIAYYAVDTGRVPVALLHLLQQAAARGVQVQLLVDGLQSQVPSGLERHLIGSGIAIRHYHPPRLMQPRRINRRLHDKLLVIDGCEMIIGSRNLQDEHFGLADQNYLDCDAYVRGSSAAEVARYFDWLWRTSHVEPVSQHESFKLDVLKWRPSRDDAWAEVWRDADNRQDYRRLLEASLARLIGCHAISLCTGTDWSAGWPDDVCIRLLHDGHPDKTDRRLRQAFEHLIDSSRHSLLIETPYPVFTRVMLDAIVQASQRGVEVVVLTNSLGSTDRVTTYAAYQNIKGRLLRAGVKLYEFNGPRTLHAKSMVVDGSIAVIGSYNFDPRSEHSNLELSIAAHDPQAATALTTEILQHLRCATPIDNQHELVTEVPLTESLRRRITMQLERLAVPVFRWLL
ncbi:MAG: phospholipase D-like domain-containing protein [Planctomycetaceae bacterium]